MLPALRLLTCLLTVLVVFATRAQAEGGSAGNVTERRAATDEETGKPKKAKKAKKAKKPRKAKKAKKPKKANKGRGQKAKTETQFI
jgi:hypothetical protein